MDENGRLRRRGLNRHNFEREHRRRENNDGPRMVSFLGLMQILPLVLFILSSFVSYLMPKPPTFTWSPSNYHQYERQTKRYKVVYYVEKSNFDKYFRGNAYKLLQYEDDIETAYRRSLQEQCAHEVQKRQQKINSARWWGSDDDLKKANEMPLPACTKLQDFT